MKRLNSATRTDALLLGIVIAALAAVYALYGIRVGNFQNDENQYLELARYISQHFPGALVESSIFPRGTQRLDQIILAAPFALMRGPGAYQLGHVIQSLLFVSTAVPVFVLARRTGLGRAASLFAATLCVIVPWAIAATSFLAEAAAYPAYAWVLYATWALIRQPSWRHQALAVLALVIAALSRTALLALVPVLPLAIIWHEWSWGLTGKPRLMRGRELPARLWSRYPLLCALFGLGVLTILADQVGVLPGRGLATLAGDYGLPNVESLSNLIERYDEDVARMAAGTGFLALALALPWTIGALVRPRDGARHALAVVCTLGLGAVLLSVLQAGPDERYVLYAAVPLSLAAAAALSDWTRAPRNRLAAAGVLAGAAVVVVLLATASWPPPGNPFDYFTFPTRIFYQRVVLERATLVHLPLIHPSPAHLAEAAVMLAAIVWVVALRRWTRAPRPAAILGVALIALCATQTAYALRKFTFGAGEGNGPGAAQRSWVDEHVPDGAKVGALALSLGETPTYVPIWRATEFWNTTIEYNTFFGGPAALPLPLYGKDLRLTSQPGSGLLKAYSGPTDINPVPLPGYLVVPLQGTNRLGLAGKIVAESSYVPLELLRLSRPARIEWSTTGSSPEGFLTPGQPFTATVYSGALAGARPRCASFSLLSPPGAGRWSYTVVSGRRVVARGKLATPQTKAITVPLFAHATPGGDTATLTVNVAGTVSSVAGQPTTARLAFFTVEDCPARRPGR
ncbi:MAG: hypothetical protein JWN10_980 [Solirubrobacterales bacterium]|nr:hypothetical protein [Solirubrobacterales bacterium]